MKHIKQLLVFFLIINVFNSCEKEEVSYALDDISAPSNVNAHFDISQDEIGLVSLTPTAEGATLFEVYFGDTENESPVEVAPGETITHTYEEGEYNLRIVAIGLTGLTSEFVRVVTISMEAPEDLEAEVEISTTNPYEVIVTPTATNATVFDVYFTEAEDEEPTTIMVGESATYEYSEAGDYTIRIVARGAGAATAEITKDVTITGASAPVKLPITFDDATVNYVFTTFNGTSFEVVDNPDVSGVNNTASKVGAITNSGAAYEGGFFALGTPVDFSGEGKTITMMFWSDVEVPVLLKFEGGVNGERQTEVVATHGGTGWELLSFNFATDAIKSFVDGDPENGQPFVPTGQYASLVLFIDGPGTTAGTFYIDNIKQEVVTAACVAETEENIDPANGPINWTFKTDDADHEFDQFGDVQTDIVANPVTDGINQSCSVQMIEKATGCATWSGLGTAIPTAIDFSTTENKIFKLKVLAQDQLAGVTLRLEKEPYPDVEPAEERVAEITEVGVWQELTFDFSDVNDKSFRSIILYFERDAACDGDVYYFDDLVQTNGGSDGNVTSEPTAAAPSPTEPDADVFSIFSDEYTDPAGVNYFPNWGQSTTFEIVSINGNETIKYSNMNYQGIEIGENVDATAFESVSIDVWSGDYTSLPLFLISSSSGEKSVTLNLTPNQWNTIEIPLSEFTSQGLSINDIIQFKFDVQPDTGGTVYIDNLYFYKTGDNGGNSGGGTTGSTGTSFPVTLESQANGGAAENWSVFENADNPPLEIVSNPDSDGLNTSMKVAKFTARTGGQPYAGTITQLETPFTLNSSNSTVKIMVWKSEISDVGIKFENAAGGSTGEIKVANTKVNEWEELTFDFSGVVGDPNNTDITGLVVFPDFQARSSDNVVYFDNITIGSN